MVSPLSISPAYGCADDLSKNCLAYAGCETLVSTPLTFVSKPSNTNSAPTNQNTGGVDDEVDAFITALESACSDTSLKTLEGIQQCHNKCQTHLCCFTNNAALSGNDCSSIHVEACNAYKPCERLVTPTDQNPLAPSSPVTKDLNQLAEDVDKACALPQDPYLVDNDWVARCHGVCASRLCCLVDARIDSNCRSAVGIRECNAYAPCEVLINNSGKELDTAEEIEDKYGDIDSVCSLAVENEPSLYDACEDRCYMRSCCFEDKPEYSCYHMVSKFVGSSSCNRLRFFTSVFVDSTSTHFID